MPGVVDTNVRNAPGWNAFLGTQINGLSDQLMGMSYDGVSSKDTGFGAANYVTPSLDSIAEVKIQTSNYQAEYGRRVAPNHRRNQSAARSSAIGAYSRHEALPDNSLEGAAPRRDRRSPPIGASRATTKTLAFTSRPGRPAGTSFNDQRAKRFPSSPRDCCRGPSLWQYHAVGTDATALLPD